jgi:hypothetical protein
LPADELFQGFLSELGGDLRKHLGRLLSGLFGHRIKLRPDELFHLAPEDIDPVDRNGNIVGDRCNNGIRFGFIGLGFLSALGSTVQIKDRKARQKEKENCRGNPMWLPWAGFVLFIFHDLRPFAYKKQRIAY